MDCRTGGPSVSLSLRWVSQSGSGHDEQAITPLLSKITAPDKPDQVIGLEFALSLQLHQWGSTGAGAPGSPCHDAHCHTGLNPAAPVARLLQSPGLCLQALHTSKGSASGETQHPQRGPETLLWALSWQESLHAHPLQLLCLSPYCPRCPGLPQAATPAQPAAKHGWAAGWQCWDAHCAAQSCTQGLHAQAHAAYRTAHTRMHAVQGSCTLYRGSCTPKCTLYVGLHAQRCMLHLGVRNPNTCGVTHAKVHTGLHTPTCTLHKELHTPRCMLHMGLNIARGTLHVGSSVPRCTLHMGLHTPTRTLHKELHACVIWDCTRQHAHCT